MTFGYSAQEIIGKPYPLIPDNERGDGQELFRELAARDGVQDFDVRRRRKDGVVLDLHLSAAPLFDAAGNVRGIVKFVEDVTESRSEERRVGKECVRRVDLGGRRIIKKKNTAKTQRAN